MRSSIVAVQETIQAIFAEQMSSSGEVPDNLEEAEAPAYEVGSQAIIEANHMPGMYGAEATIAGAFDTVAYSVTYYPTTGGDPVENHKWVIHEELADPGEAPLEPGTEVTLDADHMEGMEGATAVIESAADTTVYMIDFTTTTGEEVQNHKWVTENELSPVE
ncbi:YdhK family protein [Salinicoccus bachuensis]|uniref:YdhK family protein n=1 Tax=Salinicoccus bachuensis TaxID=3136731 RepID=A0ABZ3IDB3_9STAP